MNPSRKIAALCAGIVVCLLALWGVSLRGAREKRASFPPDWTPEETDCAEIERGGAKIVLRRGADGLWRIAEPFAASADSALAEALVDMISTAAPSDTVSFKEMRRMGRSVSELGLSPPAASVTLWSGRRSRKYLFGSPAPSGESVYAGTADSDGVFVVPAAVFAALPEKPDDMRDRAALRFDVSRVSGFDVRAPGAPFLRVRRQGAGWEMEQPSSGPASPEAVSAALEALASARVAAFAEVSPPPERDDRENAAALRPSQLAPYGLADDQATGVTLRMDGYSPLRVAFGAKCADATNAVYALVDGGTAVAAIDASVAAAFAGGERTFRDTRVFPRDASVLSVSFSCGARTWGIEKDPSGGWRVSAPAPAPADESAVASLMDGLFKLREEDKVEDGAPGSIRVAPVLDSAGRPVEPFSLPAAALGGAPALDSLRSKTVMALDESVVSRVTVACGASTNVAVRGPSSYSWRILRSGPADPPSARELEELEAFGRAIANVEAAAVENLYASADDLRRYGLDEPYATIAVDFAGGSLRRNLLVGARCGGGRYAATGEADAVFVLDAQTVSNLLKPFEPVRQPR